MRAGQSLNFPSLGFLICAMGVLCLSSQLPGASLVGNLPGNLPVMQETWVQSLAWEDPLKKELASHSSILTCKVSWTQEPGGLGHGAAKSWA